MILLEMFTNFEEFQMCFIIKKICNEVSGI